MIPLLLSSVAMAQEPTSFSIEDAIRRALETSESVATSEAAVQAAKGQGWSARSGFGPQVYGTLAYTHTFESEYDYFEEPPFVVEDGSDTGATTGKKTPTETAAFDPTLFFGQEDAWRADLIATQPIVAPAAIAATRLANASLDVAKLDLESARASETLSAARAYFDAALADQLLAIGEATLAQVTTTLDHAKLAKDLGRQSEFELLRAQVEVENQRVVVAQLRRGREQAYLQLAMALDVPEGTSIELTSPLDAGAQPNIGDVARDLAGVRESSARAAVTRAEKSVRMSKDNVFFVRAQAMPTLSASLDYQKVRYPDDPWIFDKPDPFGEGDHVGVDGAPATPDDMYKELHAWHTNFYVGATLTVPLFGFGRAFGENLSARAGVHQAEAGLELTEQAAAADSRDAQLALDTAQAQWDATAGTVEVAQRAYDIGTVRFDEGVSTQTELSDARILLEQALANRAQAARDLQLARIRLALLPALPLSGSP
jgi:outer membrane protein TolC